MKAAFADTSFYVALANPRDRCHEAALRASLLWEDVVVTTEYVLLELGNYFSSRSGRKIFVDLFQAVREDTQTEIISASPALFEEGVQAYSDRPDKQWSLTDCISFVVMNQRRITDTLTFDHHFEQAGYRIL